MFITLFAGLCQNSCFGNIQTDPAFLRYQCTGNEIQLANCPKTQRSGCGNAAGVYCGKGIVILNKWLSQNTS